MTPSWIQTERTAVRKYWTVRLQSNKTTVVIIRGRQSSAISECQEKWPWEISPSWSHGQAWFVIYDIPRRVWRPIRARTHLATPQMKEWLRRSSNSTRKGRSHHHNTDKRLFVERKSRWMSAQIFWLADWLVRDMWPECCLQTSSVSESAMLIHVWERRDFRSCFAAHFVEFSSYFKQFGDRYNIRLQLISFCVVQNVRIFVNSTDFGKRASVQCQSKLFVSRLMLSNSRTRHGVR